MYPLKIHFTYIITLIGNYYALSLMQAFNSLSLIDIANKMANHLDSNDEASVFKKYPLFPSKLYFFRSDFIVLRLYFCY